MIGDLIKRLNPLIESINQTIEGLLIEDEQFLSQVGLYTFKGGGKRLRPLVYCLSYAALGRKTDEASLKLSTAFEFFHMASLMHDDIVDQAISRRGQKAAHLAFGIPEATLAGDYLLTVGAKLALLSRNLEVMDIMVRVLRELTLGEIRELQCRQKVEMTKEEYMEVIYSKTAVLMEASCQTAAVMAQASDKQVEGLTSFGRKIGLAFQITDDILDYTSREADIGKPVGKDLAEGKITLPFIEARKGLNPAQSQRLSQLALLSPLESDGWLEAKELALLGAGPQSSRQAALELSLEAREELKVLAQSPERELLAEIAGFTVERLK
jgi:octaprenyl-diphosphate synthase